MDGEQVGKTLAWIVVICLVALVVAATVALVRVLL